MVFTASPHTTSVGFMGYCGINSSPLSFSIPYSLLLSLKPSLTLLRGDYVQLCVPASLMGPVIELLVTCHRAYALRSCPMSPCTVSSMWVCVCVCVRVERKERKSPIKMHSYTLVYSLLHPAECFSHMELVNICWLADLGFINKNVLLPNCIKRLLEHNRTPQWTWYLQMNTWGWPFSYGPTFWSTMLFDVAQWTWDSELSVWSTSPIMMTNITTAFSVRQASWSSQILWLVNHH